jgi:hypothetical protein|tara:strand:+ start:558 stop:686 length:129 start_codon:yes stop_codon:yes gene_type:complete
MIFRNLLSKIFPWIQPKGSVSVQVQGASSTTAKKPRGRPKKK